MSTRGNIDIAEVYRKVAEETGHSTSEVEKAAKSQFAFVTKVIRDGNARPVRLPFFGIFKVKPSRLKHVLARRAQKNNGESL
jgi:nucleoid DNA-binding protein